MADSTSQSDFKNALRRLLRVSKRDLVEQERREQATKRRQPQKKIA